jgi:hypothetical protein
MIKNNLKINDDKKTEGLYYSQQPILTFHNTGLGLDGCGHSYFRDRLKEKTSTINLQCMSHLIYNWSFKVRPSYWDFKVFEIYAKRSLVYHYLNSFLFVTD